MFEDQREREQSERDERECPAGFLHRVHSSFSVCLEQVVEEGSFQQRLRARLTA